MMTTEARLRAALGKLSQVWRQRALKMPAQAQFEGVGLCVDELDDLLSAAPSPLEKAERKVLDAAYAYVENKDAFDAGMDYESMLGSKHELLAMATQYGNLRQSILRAASEKES